jgi:hypothetical protein
MGGMSEQKRPFAELLEGETLTVRQLIHHWKNPEEAVPGQPHIDKMRQEIPAPPGYRFSVLFLGRHHVDEPFSEEEIEKRLNSLGWFRRENG